MNCPKCGYLLPDDAKFCGRCGTILMEASRETPPAPAQPVADYRAAAPAADYRTAASATGAAAAEKKFAPKSLVSMILGISSVSLLTIAALVFLTGFNGSGWRYWANIANATGIALWLTVPSLALGIVALVLSTKNTDTGKTGRAFRKVGKITGLIGLIASAVVMTLVIIFMIVAFSYI